MGKPQENTVSAVLTLFHSAKVPNMDQVGALFADGAVYQPLVPRGTPKNGRAAIVAELSSQFSRYSSCRCEVLAMASTDKHVFTERRDHVTMRNGRTLFSSVNAVFELDSEDRIVAWREYWDAADVARLLDITADQIHQRMSEGQS